MRVFDTSADRYRPIERRGIGGMGEVRRAVDGKIGREVAVKTLLSNDEVGKARFLREARIQALLEHPAIVPVYDIHVMDDGLPFFTMKRIRGETLQRSSKRIAPPVARLMARPRKTASSAPSSPSASPSITPTSAAFFIAISSPPT
jgi:serine/threonine protein kinase